MKIGKVPESMCILSDKELHVCDCITLESVFAACDGCKKDNLFGGCYAITDAGRSVSVR